MSAFREKTIEIKLDVTTDGETVNRVVMARVDPLAQKAMVAYLEQFAGLKVQPINKAEFREAINSVIDKYIDYDRDVEL